MAVANVRRRGVGSPERGAAEIPRLAPGACMGIGIIREGLPMSREPALLYSRKTSHRAIFSWRPQVAGAAHGILPYNP